MEDTIFYLSLSFLLLLLALRFYISRTRHASLPPSPPALPILGHLRLLKPPMHPNFHALAQKYGPIMFLRFGSQPVVVVSSSSAAEECFTRNDIVFANRPRLLLGKHLNYNYTTMTQAAYGDHWRNLRRVGAIEIFSNHRLNMLLSIRQEEIKRLLIKLSRDSRHDFAKVEMKSTFRELTFNIMKRMIAGKRYYGEDVEVTDPAEAREFREIMREAVAYAGASNPGDFLPILNWIDHGEFKKKVKRLGKKADKFLQGLIDAQRISKRDDLIMSTNTATIIGHLLSLQESYPEYYTDEIIKGFILVLLAAGTDTSAVTLEWAMSNLLNHPNALRKARDELDNQVGQEHLLDELALSKLPYLKNIMLETLRLYPAAPLLVPHMASDNCTIGGYYIPRGTMLLVNAWAIHRDPKHWDHPTSFMPDRFEKGEEVVHKLMPFGLGRRSCPGSGLAQRVVTLTLGSLIQCFDWERITEKEVDMAEGRGLTMPKMKPLEAKCKTRPIMDKISS